MPENTEEPPPPEPPGPVYTGKVTLVSCSLEDTVPWKGTDVELEVEVDSEDAEWLVRVVSGTTPGEEIRIDGTTANLSIPICMSAEEMAVSIEAYSEEQWVELAGATQEPGAIMVGGTLWAKGNLTVEDEKFTFADDTETGAFFRHNSHYAVPSEGASYAGTVYTPEEQVMAWGNIPSLTGKDPCRMVAPANTWRTPDTGQLEELFGTIGYFDKKGDVWGQYFYDDKIFFPATGVRDIETGELGYVGTNGGYWGRGSDEDGFGEMIVFSTEYAMVYYNLMDNLSTVRCVRMEDYADYEAHTPETGPAAGFEVTVTASGDKTDFVIAVSCGLDIYEEKSASGMSATFDIPAYDGIEPRLFDIWVDGTYVGRKLTQSGIAQYAIYESHAPSGSVAGDPFTLTVKCLSDMDSFDVNVYTDDRAVDVTAQGSKNNLSVDVPIPANHSGSSRELKIKVNGVTAPETVIQEHKPETYGDVVLGSVTWARGNIVLKNGVFEIGGPAEYGLYFRKNSIYGIPSDSESYGGTVYSPSSASYAWGDIPYDNQGDPCMSVAPAGIWRTPTQAEIEALHASAGSVYTLEGVKGRNYAGNNMFIPAAGLMSNGSRTPFGLYGYIRSSTSYVLSYTMEEPKFWQGMDDYGYSVRCVKRQNFADYVSHTPTQEQPADAFTLTVTCISDLASFPVRVEGGDVDITKNGSSGNPVVTFSIPANDSALDRDIEIFVNGLSTGRKVVQKAGGGIEWSAGYLIVKDGAYAFAGPQETGFFFKHNSRYGAPDETTYKGTVYGPAATAYSPYSAVPYDEVDPCTFVAPANTWRMPTQQDYKDLLGSAQLSATTTYLKFLVNQQEIYFAGLTGSLKATDGGLSMRSSYMMVRSSTLAEGSSYYYFRSKMDTSSQTVDVKLAAGVGMMVRCVRDK